MSHGSPVSSRPDRALVVKASARHGAYSYIRDEHALRSTASLPPLPHHTGAAAGLSGGRHLGCSRSGSFFAERPRRRPSKRVGSSGASVSHSLSRPLPHGARSVQSSSLHALTCDRRCPGQSGWGKSCEGERSPWQSRHPHGRGLAPELMKPGWRILRDIATRSLTFGSC